jgi:hypothetical protein
MLRICDMPKIIRRIWPALLLGVCACAAGPASPDPPLIATNPSGGMKVETIEVPGGGQLITYFRRVSDPSAMDAVEREVPFVSILRDTLGDDNPENDQLRDVWAFTYARPSIWKRAAAAVPFWYHRAGPADRSAGVPAPLLDMARPAKGTIPRVLGNVVQTTVLDPLGLPIRAVTRAYRSRVGEYRSMQLWRTLDVLSREDAEPGGLSDEEVQRVLGRTLLSHNVFGGLVAERYVVPAWERFTMSQAATRGHNWELLRQRSEENGLYFQPLALGTGNPEFALLWVDQATADAPSRFDSKFLGISDPFRDSRIQHWKDYSEVWYFDGEGRRVPEAGGSVRQARMIPLALYSLDHPRVPLMLVDFRDSGKPRRREMIRRATDDVATGVLGWTGFGNWTYLAAKTSWSFVRGRHGAAVDRAARVRAFVELTQALAADTRLNPELRAELSHRLDKLGMNPFDNGSRTVEEIARIQYQALMARVRAGKLSRHLASYRQSEVDASLHSSGGRALRRLASVATFGVYRHREPQSAELLSAVDRQRRIAWHRRELQDLLATSPRPEIVANMQQVRRSVEELTALSAFDPQTRSQSAQLVHALLQRTGDPATRETCERSLSALASGERVVVASIPQTAPGTRTSSATSQ